MNPTQFSIGLDIGSSGVKAILGFKENQEIQILAFAQMAYDDNFDSVSMGKVSNPANVLETIKDTLETIIEGYEENTFQLNVNISQENIRSNKATVKYDERGRKFEINTQVLQSLYDRSTQQHKENEEDGDDAVLLHTLPFEFFTDNVKLKKSPAGTTANTVNCVFKNITMERAPYEEFLSIVYRIKLNEKNRDPQLIVKNIVFAPLADVISTTSDEDKSEGVITINIGHGSSTATFYENNAPHKITRIPFGSTHICNDIAEVLQVNPKEAEKIMHACLSRKSTQIELNEIISLSQTNGLPPKKFIERNVTEVAEWRIKEIAALLQCQLLDDKETPTNGIIVNGAIAHLPAVKGILKKEFNAEYVRNGNPLLHINGPADIKLSNPKYSVAMGLMLASFIPMDKRMQNVKTLSPSINIKEGSSKFGFGSQFKRFFGNDDLKQGYGD